MVQFNETKGDQWNDLADVYKKLTIETSIKPITVMLERANALLPFSEATGILDNGCGPGPVISRILRDYEIPDSCTLTCSDFSEGMIKQVQGTKDDQVKLENDSPWKRVETVTQNAMDLQSVQDASKSHVTAGWVYFMTPDPQKCLSESKRVLEDGGVLSCSSWQGSQWMDLMNLLTRIRPDIKMPEIPEEWVSADGMEGELEKAGFRDVESHQVATTLSYDRWEPLAEFLVSKMPHMVMLMKDMSDKEKAHFKDLLIEEGKKMCADEPLTLSGTALVAVGRK